MKILHIGVPTNNELPNGTYMADMKVTVTDPNESDFLYEYLKFDTDTWMAKEIQEQTHVAVEVDSIDEYILKADKVLVEKRSVSDTMAIAFIMKDNVVLELVEMN